MAISSIALVCTHYISVPQLPSTHSNSLIVDLNSNRPTTQMLIKSIALLVFCLFGLALAIPVPNTAESNDEINNSGRFEFWRVLKPWLSYKSDFNKTFEGELILSKYKNIWIFSRHACGD